MGSICPWSQERQRRDLNHHSPSLVSALGFFDIFADDPVVCSYNAFAEGHCNNLLLGFHKMTVFLHQSSSTAHHKTVEGDVHLGTNGSMWQSLDGNVVIPKDALWQWVGLSPDPTIPNLLLALFLMEI